jgi:aminoglycoside 6-adenylyltransferase
LDASLIDRIIALAMSDEAIRAVILEGSLAAASQVDELSDYDINLFFASSFERYLNDDRWMGQVGDVLLYQKESLQFNGVTIPSRLVLFRDRPRVDFSFWPIDMLAAMARGEVQYESYRNGYQVLLDKDGLAAGLKAPDGGGFAITPPGRDEFLQEVYDFWFEAYCVAKYLARGNLWYAKLIENRYIKDHLYRMALWHHQAGRGWQTDPLLHSEGKRFEKWASAELIAAFGRSFSPYDSDETRSSLFAMLELFHQLARQTARQLHIQYPEQVERDVTAYLARLSSRANGS